MNRVILVSCKYYFIRIHENLAQHPSNNIYIHCYPPDVSTVGWLLLDAVVVAVVFRECRDRIIINKIVFHTKVSMYDYWRIKGV